MGDAVYDPVRGQLKRRDVRIELDYDPESRVRCVATQISQVLLNLLVNALQGPDIEAAGAQAAA